MAPIWQRGTQCIETAGLRQIAPVWRIASFSGYARRRKMNRNHAFIVARQ
jgi:hypothetical protein